MDAWLQLFGRIHPLVIHLPIGLLVGLAIVECVALVRKRPELRDASAILVWLAALSAVLAATAGWTLSHEDGYGGETIARHQRLGIALAIASVAMALLHGRERLAWAYRSVLLVAIGILLPAAHLGATLTHGEEFLALPRRVSPDAPSDAPATYAREIAPIFAASCTSCHGETKRKGGLALHSPEAVAKGGENGPVVVAGRPGASEMIRRLKLPLDAEDHMPPPNKPQPTHAEIARIEAWIATGAHFDATPATTHAPADLRPLRAALVHVEPLDEPSDLLRADFAATAASTTDVEAARLLEPVLAHVGDLALARSRISDATLALLARMPRLQRLDLRGTPVTDAGIAALAGHARLEELVLAQTRLTDAAVEPLLAMPALKKVWLWKSGVGPDAIARLRERRPTLTVDAGDARDSAAAEVEPAVQVATPAPLSSPAAPPPPLSLGPVNATCPVSGTPVDATYTIVFRGKVVGFCCAKCPAQFWAEPAKFESKLP